MIDISGEGWTNVSGTATAPPMLTGIQVTDTTPVLALRGSMIDKEMNTNGTGFRVTVRNLSTGKAVATATGSDEMGYRLAIVDIETMRAATVGDTLEISARTPNPFIGVESLRYTVTAEDVRQGVDTVAGTSCLRDTGRDRTIVQLSESVQSRDMDTVSVGKRHRCANLNLRHQR